MTSVIYTAHEQMLEELRFLLGAIESNLDLVAVLVGRLLDGETSELTADEQTFAAAVDEVLYRSGLSAMELLESLQHQREILSAQQRMEAAAASIQFEQLTSRWNELMHSVDAVWRLRVPCQ